MQMLLRNIKHLFERKHYHKIQIDTLNAISIPRQRKAISEAIQKLASYDMDFDAELKYKPTKIRNKIVKDSKLRDDIIWNANHWFRAVNTEIENAAEAKILSPERFSKSFARMYEEACEVTSDQRIIYDTIVNRLAGMIGEEYRSQCECIVSYFVQSCEVFDEVTQQDNTL